MNDVELLHNAVRHYCIERHGDWCDQYNALMASRGHAVTSRDGSWTYTSAAYDIFPRYHVLAAVLAEVERFIPADFASASDLRSLLAVAGETAQSEMTQNTVAVAVAAANEERRLFAEFVQTADVRKAAGLPLCPFRRVLGTAEHAQLYHVFTERWGEWSGGAVDSRGREVPAVVTLHEIAMEGADGYAQLRRALLGHGVQRVVELREYGDGFELEVADVGFAYNGAEGFWMDTSSDETWMVQASHEASITFGGTWLIEAMRKSLPTFEQYLYRGWDLSLYGDAPEKE